MLGGAGTGAVGSERGQQQPRKEAMLRLERRKKSRITKGLRGGVNFEGRDTLDPIRRVSPQIKTQHHVLL